ncbi:MAG: VTT domain-containing protein [Verrucomicrobiota bacterium]
MSALIHWLTASQDYFHQLGWLGVLAYAGLIVLVQLFLGPLSPVAIAGGFIFGMRDGFLALTLGTAAGAAVNFLIARHAARDAIARRIGQNEKFRVIDNAIGNEGWRIILLLRFCPVPYGFANYAYGLTAISFLPYFLTTIVAVVPANLFFSWLGASAQAGLEAALGSNRPRHPFEYALMGIGILAGFAAMAYIGKIARTALSAQPRS